MLLNRLALLLPALLLGACAASYNDEVQAPTEKQLQEARTMMTPPDALREGVFHMQRVQTGSSVRVKDQITLKKPDLPPFDVAYIGRDLESILLELANAAGESVVLPQGLRGQTVTVVHNGANFQEMLDLVLGKAGYHYNYVNGIWYITRYPVRNYILEISQSDRQGSLVSRAELTPELAAGTGTQGSSSELDTAYSDTVWAQVKDTLAELIKVGDSAPNSRVTQATGVGAGGELLTGNQPSTSVVGNNGLLPPPDGMTADNTLFPNMAGTAQIVADPNALPTVATPQSTDHTAPDDNAQPWYKLTESAGLITVRASPEAHRQIEEYLEQVQSSAHRQVVVEARIVALIKDKTTSRGADLQLNGRDVTGSALSRLGFFADARSSLGTVANSTVQGGFFTLASKAGDMALVLQSLSRLGDVYTISSPNLVARNNQISRVAVTRQLGYAETSVNQNTTTTGDVVVGSRQDTAKFKNSGTVMSVMPFIGRNNVQLRFRLSLATKAGETEIKTSVGTSTPVVNSVPEMANNLIDQDMVLEYGRIYAIGGLVENNTTINNSYEPNLRQIPGLGEIFQRATNRGQDTEFLVLLKVSRA